MFAALLILAGTFAIGFCAGYGLRESISRRHRRRSRPLAGYAEHSRFEGEPNILDSKASRDISIAPLSDEACYERLDNDRSALPATASPKK